jgi:hypothetical protein
MRVVILTVLAGLLIFSLMLPSCGTDEVADEVGDELPNEAADELLDDGVEKPPDPSTAFEGFYSVCPELEAELEQIVLADPEVQALLEGKDYSFTVDGHTIEGQDYNLAVGVRLKDEVTSEEFMDWMSGGRQDSSLIKEYVGILNIGYNDKYYFTIDREAGLVVEMQYEAGHGVIPEVTGEEKQLAVEIAMADATVQQLLAGKEYVIAPEDRIGVWHSGSTKLGVAFEIEFAQIYFIDMDLPRYPGEPVHVSGEVEGVIINVLLEENRVAEITPIAPITAD